VAAVASLNRLGEDVEKGEAPMLLRERPKIRPDEILMVSSRA
jgi:hypothetical protein